MMGLDVVDFCRNHNLSAGLAIDTEGIQIEHLASIRIPAGGPIPPPNRIVGACMFLHHGMLSTATGPDEHGTPRRRTEA